MAPVEVATRRPQCRFRLDNVLYVHVLLTGFARWKSDVSVSSYLSVLEVNGGDCDAGFKNVACPKGNGRFFKVFTEDYDPGTLLALCFIEPVCVGLVLGNDGTGGLRWRTHQKDWSENSWPRG